MNSSPADNLPQIPEPPPAVPKVPFAGIASAGSAPPHSAETSQSPTHRQPLGEVTSLLASAAVHTLALLLLSLLFFPLPSNRPLGWLQGAVNEQTELLDLDDNPLASADGDLSISQERTLDLPTTENLADTSIEIPSELLLPETVAPSDLAASLSDAIGQPLAARGGGLDGRKAENRLSLALAGGGTQASEAAVERGLAWLAAHQMDDGSWRFDLTECPQCAGACRNPGFRTSTTDSTGLALLCFLGAGYTHQTGPYQEEVTKGLYYLQQRMLMTSFGGDLRDKSLLGGALARKLGIVDPTNGNMYSQAIATLALCEAYAMTRDDDLAAPAQEAVNFIVYAQHENGGWRYEPKEPGDLSVTGWQLMALKSAMHGKLEVPRQVWYKASDYLDSVQDDRGAAYGYQTPTIKRPTMTAVGLFCRMMLGWPKDHRPLLRGITQLGKEMPKTKHMYFNYYASQVLHHHGGAAWERWNPQMREYLVALQANAGHESGSWYIDENWSTQGGRLYTTTLAILTLEVYYRYMPMYQESFFDE